MIRLRLLVVAVLSLASHAAALDISPGTRIGLAPGAPPEVINLSGTLLLNTRHGDKAAVTAVRVNAPTATIDVQGPAGTITLGGPLEFDAGSEVAITGNAACRLVLPVATVLHGDRDGILSADGPGVDAGKLTGVAKLRGSAAGCTVRNLIVSRLEKDGAGTWTITGDNSAQTWQYVAIGAGRLALAPGAKFGNSSVSIGDGATLALPAGARIPARLSIGNGATLDVADGVVGETYIPFMQCPVNGKFTLRLDISAAGVDHITVGGSAGTSGGRIVFNQVGPTLTPGTYTFITCTATNACLLEQHFGFDYSGAFENHYNIVYTSRLGRYDLIIRPIFVGNWPAMTVTVTPASGTSHRPPLALPLPGERGHEVKTGVNTPTPIPLAGMAYDGTIVSYAYTQPAHGTVTGPGPIVSKRPGANYSGTDLPLGSKYQVVTYTPAANYRGTDHFTFTATDNGGATSAPATIYIGVGSDVNLPPMANPQLGLTTATNAVKPITLSGVDYGISSSGTIVSYAYAQPAHGRVTGTGPNVTYAPVANYNGGDSFTFTVTDNQGATSTAALVSLIVGSGGANHAPTATSQPSGLAPKTQPER